VPFKRALCGGWSSAWYCWGTGREREVLWCMREVGMRGCVCVLLRRLGLWLVVCWPVGVGGCDEGVAELLGAGEGLCCCCRRGGTVWDRICS
jgi:hypothetical protein